MDISLIGGFLAALEAVHGGVPVFIALILALGAATLIILGLWRWALGKDRIIHNLYGAMAQDLREMQDETAELNKRLIDLLVRNGDRRP